ncbi:MAG TPA: VWA domain-containing protein [Candidatus Methylomirabilis sp.]|nr:VWA domain-containing protein [Candidatus Methylomirabilis sp.]
MLINTRLYLFLLACLFSAFQGSAQQNSQPTQAEHRIYLDVVVTSKSGAPVGGLQQQDFTILDNNVPQTIASFDAVDGRQAAIEVILVLDAVNVESREVAVEHKDISRFLKVDGGHLAYPTAVATLTDKGLQFQPDFSTDGNAISAALSQQTIPVRSIGRDTDRGGAGQRFQISFQGFALLLAQERWRPGRKLIVWVSPGWPPLFGLESMRDPKLEQQVFGNLVEVSKELRQGQITLYDLAPPGIDYWQDYVKGITQPSQVRMGTLALQVLATHSGGLVLSSSNSIAAQLQECLTDAGFYYEVSFDSPLAARPNEYHHLEVRVAKPGLTARTRQEYYSQPLPATTLTADSETTSTSKQDDALAHEPRTEGAAPANTSDESHSANAPPYLDEPLAQLVTHIPELKSLQPAADQHVLPVILQKLGQSVDDFVSNIGDLIADEDVTQERLNADGKIEARERVQDSYLILHHGYEWGADAEYRMDDKGNRLGPIGLSQGYLVTSGHALSCIEFSTVVQPQSRFRYLGDEKLGSRETYVLAFGQQPGVATFFTTMRGTGGADVNMLTQGILWVDKNNFQILRMRSDLLARNSEIELDQLTTDVTFGQVRLQDLPNPLWLPSDADVYIEIAGQKYRNMHHYTNYRRYRVSVKIGPSL